MENIKIEYLPLEDLKPYEKNTRKHSQKSIDNIAKSIKKYGMCDAIGIWSDKNIIVEGHGRYLACKQIGEKLVPCVRLDHLTDEERREYAIAHNATAELSDWDALNMELELEDLDLSDFDFDFGVEEENINAEDFGEDFTLPDGGKPEICQMTFTLHTEQKSLIEYALGIVGDDVEETFGNTNKNGNALYEVVKQWAERRK